ncbi:MAG: cell envelope integrity protein TolA [gamma proteobacterium symbiont of Bathyaustriella thionipta]|nr:cell envelope integrity protein TolA [gamma proteobacterium symbiont of Bathyaustriella thionipta]MCU7949701.1 cell envelope integrity protein TolA [gamma proteobacterium symbiont of Bathyaustriella thionipta]MCU7953101.1 cell envelope integrity protein TolA [gamma proteobacterium symbiont of Bathyaustriella thionipta]MCU7956291.1 cell envelope integrity protein TolA [gamma proteobacterium symbiont of Bathyaustriella thionipta]MCU7967653.1 cell envelope integrity protein TolA [gamma proteoba
MLDWIKDNSTAFAIAIVFHVVFLAALLVNWQMDKPDKIVLEQGDIIQVSSVDANSYDAEVKKLEQQKKAERQKKVQAKRKAEELAKQKKQEAIRKKKEKQRKADALKRKKAADAKKKKEALKKAELQKKAQQEKRRLEEKKKQQAAEQKRKAEEDKKRQAELKRKEQRDRAERERRSKGIINRHVALIQQKIDRSWRQPLDVPSGLQCKIQIVLLPSGNVVSVKVVESSGHASFDRSVETAVRRASPLPVPTDSVIFKQFEVMRLRFEPGSF